MHIKTSAIALLFMSLLVIMADSCRKDTPLSSGPLSVSKVKTAITTSSSGVADTVTYTYDSLGRQLTSRIDTLVTSYTYASGSVVMNYLLNGEAFATTYTTNTLGLAISDSKGNVYTYDPNNYLLSMTYTGSGNADTSTYTISGGNVSGSVQYQTATAINNVITITYTYLSTLDSRSYGLAFLGAPDKNLIQTENITQVLNGSTYTTSYSYSYTFDASGRVAQQVQASGSATYTTVYTYY